MNYLPLFASERMGSSGSFGIKILVASSRLESIEGLQELNNAAYDAARLVETELIAASIASDPEAKRRAEHERAKLLSLFPSPIYVETIPNGYSNDGYSRHLPWFVVTTGVGRFKIGWRKRVIEIDWSETSDTQIALNLFPNEDVTKSGKMIHAWSYDKAAEYIKAIIASGATT